MKMITISFKVIELIMEKTCEGTAYSHLIAKVFLLYFQLNQPMTMTYVTRTFFIMASTSWRR